MLEITKPTVTPLSTSMMNLGVGWVVQHCIGVGVVGGGGGGGGGADDNDASTRLAPPAPTPACPIPYPHPHHALSAQHWRRRISWCHPPVRTSSCTPLPGRGGAPSVTYDLPGTGAEGRAAGCGRHLLHGMTNENLGPSIWQLHCRISLFFLKPGSPQVIQHIKLNEMSVVDFKILILKFGSFASNMSQYRHVDFEKKAVAIQYI